MCCSRAAKLCMKIGKWYYKLVVTAAATTTTTPATPQQLSRPRTDNNNSLEILLWLKRHITMQLMLANLDAVSDFNGTSARNPGGNMPTAMTATATTTTLSPPPGLPWLVVIKTCFTIIYFAKRATIAYCCVCVSVVMNLPFVVRWLYTMVVVWRNSTKTMLYSFTPFLICIREADQGVSWSCCCCCWQSDELSRLPSPPQHCVLLRCVNESGSNPITSLGGKCENMYIMEYQLWSMCEDWNLCMILSLLKSYFIIFQN